MVPRPPARRRRYPATPGGVLSVGALLVTVISACHDSPLDPLAAVTTVETVPSLTVSHPIPSLAELADGVPAAGELAGPVAAWEESWADEDGEVARTAARGQAVPVLYRSLGDPAARAALASLAWLEEEDAALSELPASLESPLLEALLLRERGRLAMDAGKGEEALSWALAAADRVRSVTTGAVARRMVRRGETLLAADHSATVDVDRATHLVNGARRALADGQHALAIRRAFYACQVLEGRWRMEFRDR